MRSVSLLTFISALLLYIGVSCGESKREAGKETPNGFELYYESDQFSIHEKGKQFFLQVKHAIKGSEVSESYLLYPRGEEHDTLDGVVHFIPYPISSIAISSTTHLGYLDALGMNDQITGATGLDLFYSEDFLERVKNNEVRSIGAGSFNEEILIELSADLLFAYALNNVSISALKELRKSGIKVVLINEYLESDPLEKAAWLRFFACFFGRDKLDRADAFLISIEEQYHSIKHLMRSAQDRPRIMMGFPWKGSWHVSGGDSYQAIYYRDAGGDYLWKDHHEAGSLPLDIEVVLRDGSNADIWLNPGSNRSIDQILSHDQSFQSFEAIRKGKVYSNYKRSNAKGANDYWERGVVRPDLILKDLAFIFHPELMNDHELFFFEKLERINEE